MQSHASKSMKGKIIFHEREKTKCAKLARVRVASISVGLQRFISKVVTFSK